MPTCNRFLDGLAFTFASAQPDSALYRMTALHPRRDRHN